MATEETTYLTKEGEAELQRELRQLIDIRRPALAQKLKEAIAHGDLKENADYHDTKEQQGFVEGRIKEIEGKLSQAEVIDVAELETNGQVVFGATVDLMDLESGEAKCYRIVGEDEADIEANQISVFTPIAQALIGRVSGDEVVVEVPDGKRMFEIVDVRYKG